MQFSAEGKAALRGLSGDQVLRQQLALTTADQLVQRSAETDQLGMVHQRFAQYYQGIRVEHADYIVHSKGGVMVESINGDFERIANLNIARPRSAKSAALGRALASVGARTYKWQTSEADAASFLPTGELVIVRDARVENGPQVLAWKFNIYAAAPISRAYVYVDAHTGDVVLQDNIIKHAAATGTFATAYSGTRNLATTAPPPAATSCAKAPPAGRASKPTTARRATATPPPPTSSTPTTTGRRPSTTTPTSTTWPAMPTWAPQATYDYWKAVHGRNSYDNAGAKIKSYVHFDDTPGDGVGYENAYWDGTEMTYGDGASRFRPLTALDVCGHEIGHAVCEKHRQPDLLERVGGHERRPVRHLGCQRWRPTPWPTWATPRAAHRRSRLTSSARKSMKQPAARCAR